ncbi:SMP-30/gluconolactonase/LRE family protein [Actinokineospora auranticolor]|uniref:Sugar lactone lactonase YvrE n=1 Tax=Actinokineospora auranticolor TaxID=155976 RepID=A0A2S6GFK9_9PSEU|nr:SMP-30/gluconolactonase/LRE family protein [Actinokineospora auranticolor]PPK64017.1 sugar lactone lactonase YvrE [Actinokineospora auranticolor]
MATIKPGELEARVCVGLLGRRVDGLRWNGHELSWVDRRGGRVQLGRMTDLGPRHTASLGVDGRVVGAVPTADGWVVGGEPVLLRRDGRTAALRLPPADGIWCDPAGRLWLGTSDTLYRVDLGGSVHPVLTGPTHDLAWSPDTTTLYRVGDNGLLAHGFDLANGTTTSTRMLAPAARGVAVDAEGFVWVAVGDTVRRIDRTGASHVTVRLADAGAVGCCFADTTMLITTDGGAVHACDPGVRGLPAVRWMGLRTRGRTAVRRFP